MHRYYGITIAGFVIAALISFFIFFSAYNNLRYLAYPTATGQVTFNLPETDTETVRYRALIQFTTSDGQTITFRDRDDSAPPKFAVDQKVLVHYNPSSPNDAIEASEINVGFFQIPLGFVPLALATFIAVRFARTAQRERQLYAQYEHMV
jgi:hypothetical protein